MVVKIRNLIIGLTLVMPLLANAQEEGAPITREQVRAELVALEKAGYHPGQVSVHYPADIQAAEDKIHVGQEVDANTRASYGDVTSVNSEAGGRGAVTP